MHTECCEGLCVSLLCTLPEIRRLAEPAPLASFSVSLEKLQ